METHIVYFDETGDDGNNTKSSDVFLLTSVCMNSNKWKSNYQKIRDLRKYLKESYGLYVKEEMHTKHFLTDKEPYRKYNFTIDQRKEILIAFIKTIADLDVSVINVLIDKTKIIKDSYDVLDSALKYSIQRIENTSKGDWNYLIITDQGRIAPMRKTARAMCVYNPIHSKYGNGTFNAPIKNMIEDILDKNSSESSFIQICDFISYFYHLYYKAVIKKEELPKRVSNLIDEKFLKRTIASFKAGHILNELATCENDIALVIYPKQKKDTT